VRDPDDLAIADEPYYGSAAPLIPENPTLPKVEAAAKGCKACHLWRYGTQTVFGDGAAKARIMLVGEQPGDKEDLAGKPFVGPAGKILDKALAEAGIDPADVYTTNAVKHFKWVPKGARRIHKKPNRPEINACRPWLDTELRLVQPEVLVLLGSTAAQALLGSDFKVTQNRGKAIESTLAPLVVATVHPSSILRAIDAESRREQYKQFVGDLQMVAKALLQRHAA
jgi:uracil-DNA glycosylase